MVLVLLFKIQMTMLSIIVFHNSRKVLLLIISLCIYIFCFLQVNYVIFNIIYSLVFFLSCIGLWFVVPRFLRIDKQHDCRRCAKIGSNIKCNTPQPKQTKNQLYSKKSMQVHPTVASTDHSISHGPSCTTVDGIRNSKKFQPRKIGMSWRTDELTVLRSDDGPQSVTVDQDSPEKFVKSWTTD